MQELPAKAVMQEVSGRASTGPKDILFSKFKENWNSLKQELNEGDVNLNLFNWEDTGSAQETVALGVKQWAIQAKQNQHFDRGDYDNALHLILLLLGHPVRHWIPRPCNVSFFT